MQIQRGLEGKPVPLCKEQQEEGGKEHFCAATSWESRALALGALAVLSHPTHIRK